MPQSPLISQLSFLPWHRQMLWEWDRALHAAVPGVRQPYFDWSRYGSMWSALRSIVLSTSRFGSCSNNGAFRDLQSYVGTGSVRHTVARSCNSSMTFRSTNFLNALIRASTGDYRNFAQSLEAAHGAFHNANPGDMWTSWSPNDMRKYILQLSVGCVPGKPSLQLLTSLFLRFFGSFAAQSSMPIMLLLTRSGPTGKALIREIEYLVSQIAPGSGRGILPYPRRWVKFLGVSHTGDKPRSIVSHLFQASSLTQMRTRNSQRRKRRRKRMPLRLLRREVLLPMFSPRLPHSTRKFCAKWESAQMIVRIQL